LIVTVLDEGYSRNTSFANLDIYVYITLVSYSKKEFEDTRGAIRIRISKNRQHNGQKKKYKRTNNDQQNIHINRMHNVQFKTTKTVSFYLYWLFQHFRDWTSCQSFTAFEWILGMLKKVRHVHSDNTMAKRKSTKGQTTINKTYI
jgi:hypothetical protein